MDVKLNNLSRKKHFYLNTQEHDLEIQKLMKTKNLNNNSLSKNKSIAPSQIIMKDLPHNPYCASITTNYAFDLEQITNFNVYFWTSKDNISLNPCIEFWLNTPTTIPADNWTTYQKTQVKKALDTFTTFIGTTSTVVSDYSDCDIVCVLFPSNYFYTLCYGPYYIKNSPIFVDNKIVFFLDSSLLNVNNLDEGTFLYEHTIQKWGNGFGLKNPAFDQFGSNTIFPGVLLDYPAYYKGIGGYIQNNIFNTIMSSNNFQFFLPENEDISKNEWGYPETIMPLDALALRWLYNIQEVPAPYINTYGVKLINEDVNDIYHSRMIVGRNQKITFGSKCKDIAFYLSNQYITFNNLNYLRFEYIRNLQNLTSFYTKDIEATISVLNLKNELASIFIENRALITNLKINLISSRINQKLFLYIMDSEAKYSITGNTIIRNKATGKTITIYNPNNKPVNIYFNETIITRNINNKIENKKEVNSKKKVCGCGNNLKREERIRKYIQEKGLDKQSVSNDKSIPPSQIIIKDIPHNPYCSAVAGKYVLDLSQISNFNVYFWKSTDNPTKPPTKNDAIQYEITHYSTFALNWSTNQKEQLKKSLDIFTTFTGTTSTIVNDYTSCDIVCVLLDKVEGTDEYIGACYAPDDLKKQPVFVDNKLIVLMNNLYINDVNIFDGGYMYSVFIHEFGHAFGLGHPHDDSLDSTIMPAIAFNESEYYPAIAGYIQNNIFNTIMSYNDVQFFLKSDPDYYNTNKIGYPQTIMPLDALALRWMYNIQEIPDEYINTYGVNLINPTSEQEGQSAMIIGKNQTITFGSNNNAVNFYLTNQWFTYYNLQPIKIEYNRPIEKQWSYYPRELDSTISTINLDNTGKAFIFLENRALKVNLTVNITNNSGQVLNFYCMDCQQNYLITGNVYRNRTTNKTFTINNRVGATVNVYFDK